VTSSTLTTAAPSTTARPGARTAAWALLVLTALALPASLLTGDDEGRTALTAGGLTFLVVAILDVVVGWGLWRLTTTGAPRAALATMVTRAIAAAILAGAAVHLVARGDAPAFHGSGTCR